MVEWHKRLGVTALMAGVVYPNQAILTSIIVKLFTISTLLHRCRLVGMQVLIRESEMEQVMELIAPNFVHQCVLPGCQLFPCVMSSRFHTAPFSILKKSSLLRRFVPRYTRREDANECTRNKCEIVHCKKA